MVHDSAGIHTVDAPSTHATAVAPAPRGARDRIVVAMLAALSVVLAAVLGWQVWQRHTADTLRTEAIDTTRDYAQLLATFDYQNLDANRGTIEGMSTPAFAGKYNEMVQALGAIVADGKGRTTATVANVGVESIDSSRAVVLAFVDQQAQNTIAPAGTTKKYRMVVTLDRDGNRWIVDDVETR